MTTRWWWWWWALAVTPALAGVVSLALDVGDFRSSGLIAGVSVSIGLVGIALLLQSPWRGRRGFGRWLHSAPALLLVLVSLLGLSEGLPEFVQARGLFIEAESLGPVRVVAHDGVAVIVGNDLEGGFILVSEDGANWEVVANQAITELELVDGVVSGASIAVVGQSVDAEAVVMVSGDGKLFEETGRFSNREYGSAPQAAAPHLTGLLVISDIYGNDVEFYASTDYRTWTRAQPAPMFDDGESAQDIACSNEVCVGVGVVDATYRSGLDTNAGVVWIGASSNDFEPVDHDFASATLDAVAWNSSGFLVVANPSDDRGAAWHASDGTDWQPIPGPFEEMVVDGVEGVGTAHVVFGHHPTSGDLITWSSEDTVNWRESVVATGLPEGSEVRSVTGTQSGLLAVGIDAKSLDTLVWVSADGRDWQQTAALPSR